MKMRLICVAVLATLLLALLQAQTNVWTTATERPSDFDAFWDEAIAALDRTVPEDAQCVEDLDLETPGFRHYRVSFATYPTLLAFAVFVETVWLSHYISLGSILAAATLGVLVRLFPCLLAVRIIAALVAVFVIVKHKSNIQRLMKGCENKIY